MLLSVPARNGCAPDFDLTTLLENVDWGGGDCDGGLLSSMALADAQPHAKDFALWSVVLFPCLCLRGMWTPNYRDWSGHTCLCADMALIF